MKHFVALLAFALVINASAQTNYDTVRIRPLKITETIYMLKGAGGNIGFLKGEDGALIIDNQFGPLSGKIAQTVVEEGGGEIKMLINTHIHGDHTGGNDNFKKWGVTIVAHDNVRERMMKEGKVRDRVVPPRDKAAWPVVTFPDRMNIHWNNEDLELYHFNTGHTDGDVIIKFAKANVIHTGDMYVQYGYPFVDTNSGGGINGFIATLDQMLKIMDDNTKIIPGHGELASKKDVQAFRDRLAEIRDGVAAALKKGTKTEDIANLPIASKYDAEWGKGFVKGKDFVMMVAENLTKK
ncbi:MAG: MBL fold metallo-hydrolase [Cyclobacteriaceae bacterium]|nr:MBL fold metallo-hydrolase [Cyclobacteriaceae bacterium]